MRKGKKKTLSTQEEIWREVEKEERKKRRIENKYYYIIGALFAIMFCSMIGYFSYFLVYGREEIINNQYNTRTNDMAKNIIRGDILANDETTVLAKSEEDIDGTVHRSYPFANVFAHPIGYSTKGMTGIEKQENSLLTKVDVGIWEQIVNDITGKKVKGNNVVTTLDVGLQQFCYNALGDHIGAVVAMNPKTGEVLAMVSKPDFDPNPEALDAAWESLTSEENPNANLMNRATQGHYPPGSTFKILTDIEYIRENPDTWQNFSYTCNGTFYYNDLVMNCHEGHAHGTVNPRTALSLSCNGAFATMGLSLNRSNFTELCEAFGFNRQLDTEISHKTSSLTFSDESSDWDIIQTSIGQGKTMVSPLHMAMITSAIANDGKMVSPYLVKKVVAEDGTVVKEATIKESDPLITEEEREKIVDFMTAVVTEGSGYRAGSKYAQVAGKTGSAQYGTEGKMHAWFTGFAPVEDPQIAITIILEGGGSGGDVAAPIMGQIYDYYFSTHPVE